MLQTFIPFLFLNNILWRLYTIFSLFIYHSMEICLLMGCSDWHYCERLFSPRASAAVRGVANSQTRLSHCTEHSVIYLLSRLAVKSGGESSSIVSNSLWPHGLQSMELSRPAYSSGQPSPSPGNLPNPGIESESPALQADSLPAELWGKPESSGNCTFYGQITSCSTSCYEC